jgi:hypothetical protein
MRGSQRPSACAIRSAVNASDDASQAITAVVRSWVPARAASRFLSATRGSVVANLSKALAPWRSALQAARLCYHSATNGLRSLTPSISGLEVGA